MDGVADGQSEGLAPIYRAKQVLRACEVLNEETRKNLPTITLRDARALDKIVREAEGWLLGIRKALLWPTAPPPDDETPEESPPPAPLP